MDMNYLVQRRINAKKAYRRKVIITITLSAILLVLILIGLIKVILDEKKADDTAAGNKGNSTGVSENLTPGAPDNATSGDENSGSSGQTGQEGIAANPALTATPAPTETPTPTSVPAKKVAIDPGHGGEDLGSTRQGLYEKDANLAIALYLQSFLTDAGYEVFMVRDSDTWVELEDRPQLANNQEVDLYISIHLNSLESDSDATQGAEVWYADVRNDGSDVLAQTVVDELTKVIDTRNRGIKLSNRLVVVRESKAPACLIECGFITSETERAKLFNPEYQQKIAEGICNGIMKFLPLE